MLPSEETYLSNKCRSTAARVKPRDSRRMSSGSIHSQINALFHLSSSRPPSPGFTVMRVFSTLQRPTQVYIFFTVGCAQLKSRHTEKYNKKKPKSVHLAETNQSWQCKSPGTYVQRKQKLKHTCLAAFLFQLSPFGWSGSVFSPVPPFSVWRADRNLCHNKPQEPCTYHQKQDPTHFTFAFSHSQQAR